MEQKDQNSQDNVGDAFKDAPVEDQLWYYWNRFKKHSIILILVLVFGYVGYKGIGLYKERQLEKLQEEYQDAEGADKELAFAKRNSKEPLAGIVFLEMADKAYSEGKFEEAQGFYMHASQSLAKTPLYSRVEFSKAMCLLMTGKESDAKSAFSSLVSNSKIMDIERARAAYQLALLALEDKQYEESRDYLNIILSLHNGGIWREKARILEQNIPELSTRISI